MSARANTLALAEGLARQGREADAVAACYDVISGNPVEPLAHALLAELFLAGDYYEEAIASATHAIALDPQCAPAYLALGLAYDRRGGMWDRSVLVWQELAELAPNLATAHVQLGEALSAAAFEDEAIEAWHRALEIDPREPRAMYDLAIAALKREGIATALPGFRKAGQLDPSQDAFFFSLAGIHGGASDGESDSPDDRHSRRLAGYAFAREERYMGAAGLIRSLLADEPDDAELLALAGFIYLQQEASNEAMAVALRALAIDPRTPAAVYVLGAAFARRRGLGEHAARVFGALAKAVPEHPMSHVLLGETLLDLRRYDEAGSAYRHAIKLDPALTRARFGMAAVLLAENEFALAEYEIRRAAYHDTRRRGLFERLYHEYAEGRG